MNQINTEHRDTFIKVLERAKAAKVKFDLWTWQDGNAETEEELYTCGTSACAGGFLAVSPEFAAEGGTRHTISMGPIYLEEEGLGALVKYLETPMEGIEMLFGGDLEAEEFYGVNIHDITIDQVILALRNLEHIKEGSVIGDFE